MYTHAAAGRSWTPDAPELETRVRGVGFGRCLILSVVISVSCVSLVTEVRLKIKISDLSKRKRFENNFLIIDIPNSKT